MPVKGMHNDKPVGKARLDEFAQRLYICPTDNVLVGAGVICRYLGIASINTFWRWVELYAFPAVKRPDGVWMTTMTAIDQWIFLAAEVVNDNLERSRGLNVTAEMAADRLQRQLNEPGKFEAKRAATARRAARGVGILPGRVEPRTPYLTSGIERAIRAMHNNALDAQRAGLSPGDPECTVCKGEGFVAGGERGETLEQCTCYGECRVIPAAPGASPEDV